MAFVHTLKRKTHVFHTEIYALYLSYRDSRVKWYVQLLLAIAIVYAVSPLDLVPDLSPVLGYLDDVVIVAIMLPVSYSFLTRSVRNEARLQAYEEMSRKSDKSILALKVIGYTWVLLLTLLALVVYKFLYLDTIYLL